MINDSDVSDKYLEEYTGEEHSKNPFLMNTKFKVVTMTSNQKLLDASEFKAEDGMILPKGSISGHEITHTYAFDQERACKLYHRSTKEILGQLTGHAPQLFLHLACHLGYGVDKIRINIKKYAEANGISSEKTVYSAIKVLREAGILAKYPKPTIYWINPHVFFTGNRIKSFPDNLEEVVQLNKKKKNGK